MRESRSRSQVGPSALVIVLATILSPAVHAALLHAQGITTAEIRGVVRIEGAGSDTSGITRVRVTNRSTGFAVEAEARRGRFIVSGLEIGGPYDVVVRRIGFEPQERRGVFLALGQPLELELALSPTATRLGAVTIVAQPSTGTTISDSLLHRLPTLNRDFYDFARLAPMVSTKIGITTAGGISGGGVNFRYNSYLIDGVSDRALTGNSSTAGVNGKSVSLEAVQEYQVLLAPFDVRYGDFSGALVNTVTKSGTNDLHGSTFGYWRTDELARRAAFATATPYDREQYGVMLAGPLVRDRAHFVVAPEIQRLVSPAPGPYVGQSAPLQVSADSVGRFAELLRGYGLPAGTGGAVDMGNPLTNLFARVDAVIPRWNSTLVATERYARNASVMFSRANTDTFALSSYRATTGFAATYSSLQLRTNLAGGGYNELIASHQVTPAYRRPDVRAPVVQALVPRIGGGTEVLKAGSAEGWQDITTRWWSAGLSDNLTLPFGATHVLTLGARLERFGIRNGGVTGQFGAWTFSSLDSLSRGIAQRYTTRQDFGSVGVPLFGGLYAAYVGDSWRATDRLIVTLGLRGDALVVDGHAPYNARIDTLFGRRTDLMPVPQLQLSPRFGFTWEPFAARHDQIRGGVGIFTGRPPLSWLHAGLYSYGVGAGALSCGPLPRDAGLAPNFNPDYRAAPTQCLTGPPIAARPNGDVDLLDRHLHMAQTLRAMLAYDRHLPWDVIAAIEGLATRNLADFVFVNLNLVGPRGLDRRGRVLYGRVGPTGLATPDTISGFSEVIDLRNISANRSAELSARLEKRFSHQLALVASYTYSRVRDVQLPLRAGVTGLSLWGAGRPVSGRHDDLSDATSLYDLPHRIVVAATYLMPWRSVTTDLSLYYVGESGSPFTFVASGTGGLGDLNADGFVGNDPLYIPRSAFDTSEIRFGGPPDSIALQQSALERRIADTPCLNRQRGRIMSRNSCREPWSNTTIASVRQSLLASHGHALSAQLDVFNVLNLLRRQWGPIRVADVALLEQVGQTAGAADVAQPVFRFNLAKARWTTLPTESAYQLQLSMRYSF